MMSVLVNSALNFAIVNVHYHYVTITETSASLTFTLIVSKV